MKQCLVRVATGVGFGMLSVALAAAPVAAQGDVLSAPWLAYVHVGALPAPDAHAGLAPQPRASGWQPSPARRPLGRPSATRWEIEVHGGGAFGTNPTSGTSRLPDPGAVLTNTIGFPVTRATSSWYFGDGAVLFNQTAGSLRTQPTITPLDPALTATGATRKSGGDVGFRLSRAVRPHVQLEFGLDVSLRHIDITPAALAAIEASRASFQTAWNGLFALLPTTFVGASTSSVTTIQDKRGSQLMATGAIQYNLGAPGSALMPYVTVGAGVISGRGAVSTAVVTGNYRFLIAGAVPINENDTVTVHYGDGGHTAVALFGGGITHNLSPRSGIRADVRAYVGKNGARVTVDTSPVSIPAAPTGFLAIGTSPPIQWSTAGILQSNLGGLPIASFQSFAGSGVRLQVSATVGYVLRF
jgi:hypothetical protein